MATDLAKGYLDLMLLSVLRDGPRHGYAVISELRDRTDGTFDLPEGTVYPALHRLQDGGLLASDWKDVAGRRRRVYRLTEAGGVALVGQKQRWHSFTAAVDTVLRARPSAGVSVAGSGA